MSLLRQPKIARQKGSRLAGINAVTVVGGNLENLGTRSVGFFTIIVVEAIHPQLVLIM